MTKKTIGKYELLEELGRGGFGTVYRAHDTTLDVERAVKVLHPVLVSDPEFIARFRREAKFAAKLEHPHIVPVYELGESEGSYFLAMKYMPGGSLKDALAKDGQFSFPRTLEIIRQIASGLDYAHKRELVHRDIKPANILFEEELAGSARETVRLSDFGFAKILSGEGSASLSVSGGMIGTPSYMAPEVWKGENISPATDIYSLACVFFEMVTGRVLFDGDSPPQVMTKHMLEGPQFPAEWAEQIPEGIQTVLERALQRELASRYLTAGAFVAAIEQLSMQEHTRREADAHAQALLREAESLLAEDSLEAAREKLIEASALAPELSSIASQVHEVEERIRIKHLYTTAVEHFTVAKENAQAVLAGAPGYPDSQGIFPSLGLRNALAARASSRTPVFSAEQTLRGHEKFMPYLLILLGLATSWLGGGVIGLAAGIGLFWRKNWARRAGMVFAGLLEAAGIVTTIVVVIVLAADVYNTWITGDLYLPLMICSGFAILLALYLFQIMGDSRLVAWTSGEADRPPGLWGIITGLAFTLVGLIPAIFLLKQKGWARKLAQGSLMILSVAIPILAMWAISDMSIYQQVWVSSFQKYINGYVGVNLSGQIMTAVMAVLFIGLCIWAFFYLRSPRVRAYFAEENKTQ